VTIEGFLNAGICRTRADIFTSLIKPPCDRCGVLSCIVCCFLVPDTNKSWAGRGKGKQANVDQQSTISLDGQRNRYCVGFVSTREITSTLTLTTPIWTKRIDFTATYSTHIHTSWLSLHDYASLWIDSDIDYYDYNEIRARQ